MEAGRLGSFRISASTEAEIQAAVREAMAGARASAQVPGFPHLAHDDQSLPDLPELWDAEVLELDPREARRRVEAAAREGDLARLEWREARLAVASSRGVSRAVRATEISLQVRSGMGPGSGFASAARRRLGDLPIAATFERAHDLQGEDPPGEPPKEAVDLLLAPEAVAGLLDSLSRNAFTSYAYQLGDSFLREYMGEQVFDRALTLRDDGLDPAGLPFPCDLEGTIKRSVTLVEKGVPRTPAIDQLHAATLGLPPTPHACAGDDARAEHLFIEPGDQSETDLLAAAEDGVWIGSLGRIETYDRRRLMSRATLRGVRSIRDGRLAGALPDLRWDGSLLGLFGQIKGVGDTPRVISDPSGELGALTVPSLLLRRITGLRAL